MADVLAGESEDMSIAVFAMVDAVAAAGKGHTAKNCGGTALNISSTIASSNMGGKHGRVGVGPADDDDALSASISISPVATAAASEACFLLMDAGCGNEELLEEDE